MKFAVVYNLLILRSDQDFSEFCTVYTSGQLSSLRYRYLTGFL